MMTQTETVESILRPLAVLPAEKQPVGGERDPRFAVLRRWGHAHLPEQPHDGACLQNYQDMVVDTSLSAIVRAAAACDFVIEFYPPDSAGFYTVIVRPANRDGHSVASHWRDETIAAARALVTAVEALDAVQS